MWRATRNAKLSKDPLCERHVAMGCTIAAVLVHHKDRNELNNYDENLESLCNECHEAEHKGQRWGRKTTG